MLRRLFRVLGWRVQAAVAAADTLAALAAMAAMASLAVVVEAVAQEPRAAVLAATAVEASFRSSSISK
jgi:hypothetical protein